MTQRKFVLIALLVALAVSALTPLTFGLTGKLVHDAARWLAVCLHGPLRPDGDFV